MLLEIAQWLAKDVRVFNVFNYITLRAVLACLTALAVSLILGPYMIRKLTAYKIGQAVREEGPRSHLTKAGTPTMGGALILVSICLTPFWWGISPTGCCGWCFSSRSRSARSAGSTTTARWCSAIRGGFPPRPSFSGRRALDSLPPR